MSRLSRSLGLVVTFTSAFVVACSNAVPTTDDALGPQDFARGLTIEAPDDGPFALVALPEEVLAGTAWPDLRDIRVFNAASESVPYARVVESDERGLTRRLPLQSFQLRPETGGSGPEIAVQTGPGNVELRLRPGTTADAGVEYLLALADTESQRPIERLLLDWQAEPRNWEQRVTVAVSADLLRWDTVATRQPLMDLGTADGGRLKHSDVVLDPGLPRLGKYWRVTFAPGFAPTLTRVEGESRDAREWQGVALAHTQARVEGSRVYDLGRPHPISHLRITPGEANTVLPLQIDGRAGETDPWLPLGRTVAFRVNDQNDGEQFSGVFEVGGRLLAAVRLTPISATWGASSPDVTLSRAPVTLVVNTRGAGPFLLAWGARAAGDSAVDLGTLVPTLATDVPVSRQFPDATLGERQVLGGEGRLTAESPAERDRRWQTMLVWVALVGGVGVLSILALRLLRETKAAAEPPESHG